MMQQMIKLNRWVPKNVSEIISAYLTIVPALRQCFYRQGAEIILMQPTENIPLLFKNKLSWFAIRDGNTNLAMSGNETSWTFQEQFSTNRWKDISIFVDILGKKKKK